MTALRELQRLFADAVRGQGSTKALELRLRGATGLAHNRVAVYADAYLSRLSEALSDDYPKVAGELGDRFIQTVRHYVRTHPSDHPSLRHFGRHFPEFLAAAGASDAPPWVADLARLEWARIEAFDAADSPALTFEDVRGASGRRVARSAARTCAVVPKPRARVERRRRLAHPR